MKNDSDQANYNREFRDLQLQIYDLAQVQFNGSVSLPPRYLMPVEVMLRLEIWDG